jgi:CxxC-x17-CxxC domain-containing protein
MYTDKTLVCKECGNEFEFTAGEQEFYAEKGFQNEPTRCKSCRSKREHPNNKKELYDAVCAECGQPTKVPFKPHLERPVLCSKCFAEKKQ